MKLLIVGSRSITDFDLSKYIPSQTDLIISGGATGVDSRAETYADQHKISKLILRPKYHLYGKAAPIKRNEQMVDLADEILIIWDGLSRGAQSTLNYAKKKNKSFMLIQTEKKESLG